MLWSFLCIGISCESNFEDTQTKTSSRNISGPQQNEKLSSSEHAEVLAIKLVIGNIESNPGPTDLKEFLGFLYTDMKDVNIKNVLNDFKAANGRG